MPQQGAELPGWAVNQIRSILDSTAEAIYGIDLRELHILQQELHQAFGV